MDWMYDGMQVQKEDYLLGKKIDKMCDEKADSGKTHHSIILHKVSFFFNTYHLRPSNR